MIPKTTEGGQAVSFKNPHKYEAKKGNSTQQRINPKHSEICCMLGALGRPNVFYAGKQNKYFRDMDFKKPFSDKEIQALDLPIPAEIDAERKKMRKQNDEDGVDMSLDEIVTATMPQVLNVTPEIEARLAKNDPLDRTIRRLNRSTLGK
jgi:hypothetical protein